MTILLVLGFGSWLLLTAAVLAADALWVWFDRKVRRE